MHDTRLSEFTAIHSKIAEAFVTDIHSGHKIPNKPLANAYLNIYKIHVELTDATLSLLANPLLSHVASGILIRTMFENYAMFSYLCESSDKIINKYLRKINYFKGKTEAELKKRLRATGPKSFANISRIDEKGVSDRIALLGDEVLMAYSLLSAYTHASPFITKQLPRDRPMGHIGKYGHLSILCILTESLLALAMRHDIVDEKYADMRLKLKNLIDFPEI